MKRQITLIILTVTISSIFIFACNPEIIRPGSEKCLTNCQDPDWVHKPKTKDTDQLKAFVGQSFKHSTERMAIEYAENNAREKVLDNLWGAYGKRKLRQALANAGVSTANIISDAIVQDIQSEWKTRGIVKGDMEEYHVQKWEKYEEAGGVSYFYIAKVLFTVDRDLVKKFLTDALQNQQSITANETDKKNIERALGLVKNMQSTDFKDWQ